MISGESIPAISSPTRRRRRRGRPEVIQLFRYVYLSMSHVICSAQKINSYKNGGGVRVF